MDMEIIQDMDLVDMRSQDDTIVSKSLLGTTKQKLLNDEQEAQMEDGDDKEILSDHDHTHGKGATVTASQIKPKKKPAYLQSLNEQEKQANFKIIEKMNKKISFLKNPRFKTNKAPIIMTEASRNKLAFEAQSIKYSSFRVEPPTLNFQDYEVNGAYELPLKITNVSEIMKRIKFCPPESDNFTVKKFKYPSEVTGDIAPGMSLCMSIVFKAPSFADFEDNITFVTEESSFKIPLKARRDPPQISLSNPMDCLNSWIGDRVDMAFRCQNTGGDGGFKFFCEKDEDDSRQVDADSIKIGNFSLSPSEFYLYSGSAIDVYVSFSPELEGQLQENLILACDNQTSEFYKLFGYGAMVDLEIIAVDGKEVNFAENPFETVYFENTNPTSESKRTIRVKNSSPILVPFHWSIYKHKNSEKITLENEDTHYRVEPSQGKIQGGGYQDFEVYFCPQHAEPYFEFADLIIEDIPITSVRNPPQSLKSFAQANTVKNMKVPMPTYVGSNTQFLSIPMISFNLRGQGNSCKIQVEPSFCEFEGDTYINHEYRQTLNLYKRSEGKVNYQIRLEGKNRDTFEVDVESQGVKLSQTDGVIRGEIDSDQKHIELDITTISSQIGNAMAYFYIEIEDGAPISFQVRADFRGPIIKMHNPVIDFGLVKVNTSERVEVQLENQSPIPAVIMIKKSVNEQLTFKNMISVDEARTKEELNSSHLPLIYDRPFQTPGKNKIQFENYGLMLQPFEKKLIQVSLDSFKEERIDEHFEVMVRDSSSQFFSFKANVEAPQVSLNRVVMNLGRIYAGVTEYINPQSKHNKSSLVLKNYGNLPAQFKWENINDPERVIAIFEPLSGVIQPRSEVKIKMTVTVYTGGNLNDLFLCDINDMEMPLGFEMLADAYGLNVSYETQEDQNQASIMNQTGATIKSKTTNKTIANQLSKLNFPHCTINKTSSQKFTLKNLSGIKTTFDFDVMYFAPTHKVAPKEKSELERAREQAAKNAAEQSMNSSPVPGAKNKKKVGFAASSKGGFNSTYGSDIAQARTRPILSDEHEQTQKFSSAVGETFTKTKQLEKDMGFFLSNNKGIAVVFSPFTGDLPPYSEVPVTVTVYNNVCGKFDDTIVSKVKGLPQCEFPVSINITGSPVRIPPNQVGINYNTIPATLPLPTVVAKTKQVVKTFVVKNTGIKGVEVNWKIFDQKVPIKKLKSMEIKDDFQQDDEGPDLFDVDIIKNQAFDKNECPFKFELNAIEPEPTLDSAFSIKPPQTIIGSRSTFTFTVTFDPSKGTGNFQSIVLASPMLSQDELEIQGMGEVKGGVDLTKKGSLGVISLNLDATTIDPKLSIDKKLKMDGENHLKLKYWSINTPEAPSKVQKLIFTNTTKADLTFNLNINGPFEIVKTKSNSGAQHPLSTQNQLSQSINSNQGNTKSSKKIVKPPVETMFCLQPLKIVEVSVRFKGPSPADTAEWPMTILNEKSGELVAYFNNGDQQKLYIDAVMMRPRVLALTDFISKNDYAMDELDFGQVNVERDRTIHIYLSNVTDVSANWQLNYVKFPKKRTIGHNTTTVWEKENIEKEDDPEVFEFSTTQGELRGRSFILRKMPEGGNTYKVDNPDFDATDPNNLNKSIFVQPTPMDEEEVKYVPEKIFIKFKPKANVLYKSKFRFICENGIACDVILKGHGSYEENYD